MGQGHTSFDGVSEEYGGKSLVQQAAARRLISMLALRGDESVLDVGCGPGHITRLLANATLGRVVGVDVSQGMIETARATYPGLEFIRVAAEDLDFHQEFDDVFCNSTMQWFTDADRAVRAMWEALKPGGTLGLACPSTPEFAPWFNEIVRAVAVKPEIEPTFAHWRSPWFHLPDIDAYHAFFEERGFTTAHIGLIHESDEFTVEDAFGVFITGAAQGLLGAGCYDVEVTGEYVDAFSRAVREQMERRAAGGLVVVDFNRLYYIGTRE